MRTESGFSLLELLITLLISAILMSHAVPAADNMLLRQHRTAQTHQLLRALQFARGEAMRTAGSVSFCGLDSTGGCAPAGQSWTGGTVTFLDLDRDGALGASDEVLARADKPSSRLVLQANRNPLVIRPAGAMGLGGSVLICDGLRRIAGRAIVLRLNGRMYSRPACQS